MSELTKLETFFASQANQVLIFTTVSAIVGAVTQVLGHNEALSAGAAAIAGAIVGVVWPAKPALKVAISTFAADATEAVVTKNPSRIVNVIEDGLAVETALTQSVPSPIVPVAPVAPATIAPAPSTK